MGKCPSHFLLVIIVRRFMLSAQQSFDPWKQTKQKKIKTFRPQKALVLQIFDPKKAFYFPVIIYPEMKGIYYQN